MYCSTYYTYYIYNQLNLSHVIVMLDMRFRSFTTLPLCVIRFKNSPFGGSYFPRSKAKDVRLLHS